MHVAVERTDRLGCSPGLSTRGRCREVGRVVVMRDTGRMTVGLIIGITIACGLPVFLMVALFTETAKDLDAPLWVLGVIVAAYWVVAALVSVSTGGLTRYIGARSVLLLSLVAAVVSLVGTAGFSPSWGWLIFWATLGGFSAGASQPGMNQLLTLRVSVRRRPLAFGLKQSATPLATMLCGLAIPFIALTIGWRWAFWASALLAVLVIVLFLQLGPRPIQRRAVTAMPLGPGQTRFFIALAGISVLGVGGVNIVVAYGMVSAIDRGIDTATAGFLLGGASAAGAIMRIVVGGIFGVRGGNSLTITAALQLAGVVGIVLMIPDSAITYAIGLIIAFAIGWGWPGLIHLSVATIAGPATPSATGIVQTGSYIGSAGGPLLAGIVYSTWGDQSVWIVSATMLFTSGVLAYTISRRPYPPQPVLPLSD